MGCKQDAPRELKQAYQQSDEGQGERANKVGLVHIGSMVRAEDMPRKEQDEEASCSDKVGHL